MARSTKPTNRTTKKPDKTEDATRREAAVENPEAEKDESVEAAATDETLIEDAEIVEEISADDVADEGSEPAEDVAKQESGGDIPGVIPAHVGTEAPSTPLVAAPPPAASGRGGFGLVLGGLAAGAIGFLAATFAMPDDWRNSTPADESLVERIDEQSDQIAALANDLRDLGDMPAPTADVDLAPLMEDIRGIEGKLAEANAALNDRIEALETLLTDMDGRLTVIETREASIAGAGSAAMEAQLEQFRQKLDDVTADAEARIAEARDRASQIEAEAAAAAAAAERDAALAAIRTALDNGTPFADLLTTFDGPPASLETIAAKGAPTLLGLQADFPSAARNALSQTRSVPAEATATERLTAFLKRQTNARSLAPKEGSDPDAILSRAEAAVSAGDLEAAVDELSALPDDAGSAMSGWLSSAQIRLEALRAVDTLANASN